MKLISFLKDKVIFILAQCLVIVFLWLILSTMKMSNDGIVLVCGTYLSINIAALSIEFIRKKRYYDRTYATLEKMDKKQHISQMIEQPGFCEGEILTDILAQATKAMNDEIATYKIMEEEYREYIETWIHEIKTPIACAQLICENNKNDITKNLSKEIHRIDGFVEQALYYARGTNLENDFSIRKINLNTLIKNTLKKYSSQLISAKTQIRLEPLDYNIYGDPKWLDFILGQLITNSIKYKKDPFILHFSVQEMNDCIILYISDNGIGISPKDISKVFQKGFTGENGRIYGKSTGIGLYLCKRLCTKMHLGLEIQSLQNEGTTIKIKFSKDKDILF